MVANKEAGPMKPGDLLVPNTPSAGPIGSDSFERKEVALVLDIEANSMVTIYELSPLPSVTYNIPMNTMSAIWKVDNG